jgi:hypothetical protein
LTNFGFIVFVFICKFQSPASTVIEAIGGANPKPGNGEGCVRKGIRRKILASALLFEYRWII